MRPPQAEGLPPKSHKTRDGEGEAWPILDLIEAFRRSKTMFTAVRLGVFDALAEEPQGAAALATELGLNEEALRRLLDGCVSLGLVERVAGEYRNTELAERFLVSASAESLAGYITYSDQSLYVLWSHLDDAVREGTNRWTQAFGGRNALFDFYFRDPVTTASFLGGMHGFGQMSSPSVVRVFDLSGFTNLADLGGATGHLAMAACEAYPQLRATVVDLPPVVPYAQQHIAGSEARERIGTKACDFFTEPLPVADLYALGRILHDWSDERIGPLLSKIFAALPEGGGLLIAETLLEEDRTGPRSSVMQDLNMLVCTEGRERTLTEYEGLLKAAGFATVDAKRTGTPLDAILARK